MQTQSTRATRVLLASEQPDMRHLLAGVVQREPGAVVVGQAENGVKAVALARSLRPDVVMVDSSLPHVIGLDAVPLSRIGGFDAAMDISHELPQARVVLLAGMAMAELRETGEGDVEVRIYRHTARTSSPIKVADLRQEHAPQGLLFADLAVGAASASRRSRAHAIADKATAFGALAILGGLGLMATLILAQTGVLLAMAGAASLLLGVAFKGVTALRARLRRRERVIEEKTVRKTAEAA